MSLPRRLYSWALTALAAGYLFLALELPDTVAAPLKAWWRPGALLRIPLEGIIGAAILLVLPQKARRVAGIVLGAVLGVLVVLRAVGMGFREVFAREFVPALDWPLFGDGFNALTETYGRTMAWLAVALVVLLVLAIPVVTVLAVLRLTRFAVDHQRPARISLVTALAAWTVFSLTGTTIYPFSPVAATQPVGEVSTDISSTRSALHDKEVFAAEADKDPYRTVPASQITSGLRGDDVVVGVVESYGRAAIEDPAMGAITGPALADANTQLAGAGFQARTGWVTSPTYGGGSWYAHSTFQSGMWINNEQRYRQLVSGNRLTLTSAFHKAGWQTYGFEPGNTADWPEAKFYGYDKVYDDRTLGYKGKQFGWSSMPDQYTIAQFQQDVYAKKTGPIFAEITLTSSHEPWTDIPSILPWDQLGNGSVYGPIATANKIPQKTLWASQAATRAAYAKSVVYSVDSLVDWVKTYADPNLVLIMFGDHQALPFISGQGASHDIPITIIAHDPATLARFDSFGWTDGLKPAHDAPVWPMSAFRDKFFGAISSAAPAAPAPAQKR